MDAPLDSPAADNRTSPDAGQGLAQALTRLRTTAKVQLLVQRTGLLGAAFIAYVILAALIDYFLRMPVAVRMVLWLGSVAGLVAVLRAYFLPALRFRPSLTQVALRVEGSPQGRAAGLGGVLASALELSGDAAGTPLANELRGMTARDARRRFTGAMSTSALLTRTRLLQSLLSLSAAAIPLILLLISLPVLSGIGASRVLTPWSSAAWPKRTGVLDANPVVAHAAGTALPLRAILTRSSQRTRAAITVNYRVITNGKPGIMQRALLTAQNKPLRVDPPDGGMSVEGELFERLLDTTSMVPPHKPAEPAAEVSLEYAFETSDDETAARTIAIVEPPSIVASTVDVAPPAYAAASIAAETSGPNAFFHASKDAGVGRDDRSTIGPILAGSRVELSLILNKPIPVPDAWDAADPVVRAWLNSALPGIVTATDLSVQLRPQTMRVAFSASANLRLPVQLTDSYGIAAAEDAAYRFDVVEDLPPAAAIIEPSQDEFILPTALIDAAAEGRDDVGLASAALAAQVARPPAGSAGAPPEAQGDPTTLATAEPASPGAATVLRAETRLDISTLNVVPGDEVWLTGAATDAYALGEARHATTISARRRLRIISEIELVEQFRGELAGVREAAKRLEQDQDRLGQQRAQAAADTQRAAEQAQRQDAITDRTAPLADALARLSNRAERNRLTDTALEGLLSDAADAVRQATEQSEQAAAELNKLATPSAAERTPADAAEAEKAQKAVQEQLSQLANMLDRGQDTWAVRRSIEKLLTEQKQVTAQTAATDPAAKGQETSALTQPQRDELNRLAQRQKELAQRAEALTDVLQQRADQMQKVDPAQAQAMQNAANKAREQRVQDKQNAAAQQIQKNNTDDAQQQQQQAEQSLQSMLDELDKAEQQRDQALRRVLADLIESLDKLIASQQTEIDRLAQAMTTDEPAKPAAAAPRLDTAMITLHQNTLAVYAAAKSVREAATAAGLIDAAAAAQAGAITNLREPDQPAADANERTSLARLKEAKAEAEKLNDDAAEREAQRKRDELKKAYREALELEVALRAETAPFLGKDLDRRERQTVRGLSQKQDEIRLALAELRSKTQEMDEARLFDYAHTRLDQTATSVAALLGEGRTIASIARDQSSIVRILQGLIEAVEEMDKKKDDFREEESGGDSGGGGGSQQQPLIPPIAELKLLRAMQMEVADMTRAAAESGDAADTGHVSGLQRELADQAKALLERLHQQDEPGEHEGPEVLRPKPEPKPKPGDDSKPLNAPNFNAGLPREVTR